MARSTPNLTGWERYGEAKVASTIVTTPGRDFPSAPNASRSRMDIVGFVGVSPYKI